MIQPTSRDFVRFDAEVVGERPYEVHVVAHAARWQPGMAEPTPLRGADEPSWVTTKADEIRVAIYKRP